MLSHTFVRYLSQLFNGDIEDKFSYKSGPNLVLFFNEHYGFSDSYGPSFPSRWAYSAEKLVQMINSGKFNQFLNQILSINFLMRDRSITEVEAVELGREILELINRELKVEGYMINKKGKDYNLLKIDEDLVFIGEGGFATVHKSKSTGLIIKNLKEDFLGDKGVRHRFKREFEITKSLGDIPGIIKVYEFNENEYSYTMEEAEKTLYDYIMEYEHTSTSRKIMIRQILNLMKLVHERNIIHRDLSPQNVLIVNGMLKISDFGLGKDLDIFHSHRTVNTSALGQYAYCAPEQFMKLKEGDKRSDVYSLGGIINFILNQNPTDKRHYLRSVVDKARNENPNLRYENAEELLKSVEKAIIYEENIELKLAVRAKIEKGSFDEDVENYIFELNGEELCKQLLDMPNFENILIEFMSFSDSRANEIMLEVENFHNHVCGTWSDHDVFSSLSYSVVSGKFSFVAKERAAMILNYNAKIVNRFHAQRLIEELKENGVEPMIEDTLDN